MVPKISEEKKMSEIGDKHRLGNLQDFMQGNCDLGLRELKSKTSSIIFRTWCKRKMWGPSSEIIRNFYIATADEEAKCEALVSGGSCDCPAHTSMKPALSISYAERK